MARPVTSGRGRAPLREGKLGTGVGSIKELYLSHNFSILFLGPSLTSDRTLTEKESIESV